MVQNNSNISVPYDGDDGIAVTSDPSNPESTQLTAGGIDIANGKVTTGMPNGNIHNHIVFGNGAFLRGFSDSTIGSGEISIYLSYIIIDK